MKRVADTHLYLLIFAMLHAHAEVHHVYSLHGAVEDEMGDGGKGDVQACGGHSRHHLLQIHRNIGRATTILTRKGRKCLVLCKGFGEGHNVGGEGNVSWGH